MAACGMTDFGLTLEETFAIMRSAALPLWSTPTRQKTPSYNWGLRFLFSYEILKPQLKRNTQFHNTISWEHRSQRCSRLF